MKKFIKTLICIILAVILSCSAAYPYVIKKYGDISVQTIGTKTTDDISLIAERQKRREENEIRIMSANLFADYEGFGGSIVTPRASQFIAVREAFSPDVVALQEMSFNWYCCLQNNDGSYKMVRPLSTFILMKMTALIYNAEKMRLIKSGDIEYENSDDIRTRRAVWGMFSQRNTGKTFIVVSTHLSFLGESGSGSTLETIEAQADALSVLVKTLENENNCPVIIAGDFNAKESSGVDNTQSASEVYEKLAKKYSDVRFSSKEQFYGTEKTVKSLLNDHIFIKGDVQCAAYSVLSFKCLESMSDHYPIFADVRL